MLIFSFCKQISCAQNTELCSKKINLVVMESRKQPQSAASTTNHKAGFVHIVGKPNAGKSTLLNGLVGCPISIATYKPQTTRHNIVGIDQGVDHQVVYVDTPGYLDPAYALQKTMMRQVHRALVDGDLLLWIVDIGQVQASDDFFVQKMQQLTMPCFLLLNKIDVLPSDKIADYVHVWQQKVPPSVSVKPISALNPRDIAALSTQVRSLMPTHPPYYDRQLITDKSMRFLAADIIRKTLFTHYRQEIPYSTEIVIEKFEEKKEKVYIEAILYVERPSQRAILIGKQGAQIKKMGIEARQNISFFLQKSVFLKQHVKVLPNWRNKKDILSKLGYQ